MKNYIIKSVLTILLYQSINVLTAKSQVSSALEIGDSLPHLTLETLTTKENKIFRTSDVQGKFLIIDFWATWCGPCLEAIPKMNELQKKFKTKFQILMVSAESKNTVQTFYDSTWRLKGINILIPTVYEDQELRKMFPHQYIPHYIWVNKRGKIVAITGADAVNEMNISRALKNDSVSFYVKKDRGGKLSLDINEPFFNSRFGKPVYENTGNYGMVRYKTVITKMVDSMPKSGGAFITANRILQVNNAIWFLYRNAFAYTYGKYDFWPPSRMDIQVKDKTRFIPEVSPELNDRWARNNKFIIDITLPDRFKTMDSIGSDSSRKMMCEIEKLELERFFGYTAKLEKRKVTCLVLKANEKRNFVSKDSLMLYNEIPGKMGATFKNQDFSWLWFKFKYWMEYDVPMIDETNYDGKVSLKIDGPLTKYQEVNKQIKPYGLELVLEERVIDMLVIRDKSSI